MYFARHDFFGGFGPEADTPGLSLWAIGETSQRANDAAFNASVWPNVHQKAEFIVRMRHTTRPILALAEGPIVPSALERPDLTLVCEPARDGLIVGRMDWGRPLLFVNASAYAGLRAAARMARRQPGRTPDAVRWDHEADELRVAWWHAFDRPAERGVRAGLNGLWPTDIASDQPVRYAGLMQKLWQEEHNADGSFRTKPLWTYFEVAEAHQWLLLGEVQFPSATDRAWQLLTWFWNNQASPGLYTWWEGDGEENSFGLWKEIRGWVKPTSVTPHYWTAAEMLSLQLDMLVHEKEDGTLVIGLGIPHDWLAHTMSVDGIFCSRGRVSWKWDGKELVVKLNGLQVPFVAGPAFTSFLVAKEKSSPSRSSRNGGQ